MDNNTTPPENSEGKKNFNKPNNYRRRRPPQRQPQKDQSDNSPNGSITVKPGRYDLPPEAEHQAQKTDPLSEIIKDRPAQPQDNRPRQQKPRQKNENQNENHPSEQKSQNRRRPRSRRRSNQNREQTGTVSDEELIEITEEEKAISEYIAVTSPAEGEPTEAEIIEELNSALSIDEAPGTELPSEAVDGDRVSADSEATEPEHLPEPLPEPEPLATYEIIGVRFKSTGKIYYFDPDGHKLRRTEAVIVDTARGLEFGIVDIGNRIVTEREVVLPLRKVIRRATPDDIARSEANAARAAEAFTICGEKIAEHKLDMKLVDVEYTFDNSKLLFYFTAEGRVDFRELVKDLAAVFRTRIELRQIGIRDETKLLGGIGICGRPFCCKTFLTDFVQVSIKMAKEQNLSLNSTKISGACGRLMCCLRYEYDTYAQEIRKTPRVDQIVTTPDGEGIVTEVQPLAGLCRVRFTDRQDMPPKVYHRDVLTVIGGKGVKKKDIPKPTPEVADSDLPDDDGDIKV